MRDHPAYSASEEETGHIHETADTGSIWRRTAIAAAVSLVANLIIYFVGVWADWIPEELPDATASFNLLSVVLLSTIPVFIFGGIMHFLGNNAPRASRLFAIILLVVLILAVMFPFILPDVEGAFRYMLVAMHVVTAAAIYSLTQAARN